MAKTSDIITALTTLIDTISSVQAVYGYMPQQIEAYPAVVVMPIGHEESYLSLRDTRRQYNVLIRVIANIEGTNDTSQTTVRDIVDDVIDLIGDQTNIKLGGVVDYSQLTEANYRFDGTPATLFIADITYRAQARYTR